MSLILIPPAPVISCSYQVLSSLSSSVATYLISACSSSPYGSVPEGTILVASTGDPSDGRSAIHTSNPTRLAWTHGPPAYISITTIRPLPALNSIIRMRIHSLGSRVRNCNYILVSVNKLSTFLILSKHDKVRRRYGEREGEHSMTSIESGYPWSTEVDQLQIQDTNISPMVG